MAMAVIFFVAFVGAWGQDCSGQGLTWGLGIGPAPAGCDGPSGTAACTNPTCYSPPCAAPLLSDVGCTTVSGTETYNHEMLTAGTTINSGAHIRGPFQAGFTSQQDNIISTWGCSTPSVVYDSQGGADVSIVERRVAHLCSIEFPRIVGNTYYGVVGPCGGRTNENYNFHRSFSCLYSESGGHSTKVGDVASHGLYGKWEDYSLKRLPLLDACGAHIGPTPDSAIPVYHYHAQDQAPFSVGCYGPSQKGGLVSVAVCRSLYSDCDNDGGSGSTIVTETGNVQYDRFCPCFDAAGSNMGNNIQELPSLSSSEIDYSAVRLSKCHIHGEECTCDLQESTLPISSTTETSTFIPTISTSATDTFTSSSTLGHFPPNFHGSFEVIVSDPQAFMNDSAVKKIMEAVLETLWGLQVILSFSFEPGIGRRLQGGVRVQYHSPEQVGQLKLAQLETQIAEPSFMLEVKNEMNIAIAAEFAPSPSLYQITEVQKFGVAASTTFPSTTPLAGTENTRASSSGDDSTQSSGMDMAIIMTIIIAVVVVLWLCCAASLSWYYITFLRSQSSQVHPQKESEDGNSGNQNPTLNSSPDASAQMGQARDVHETNPQSVEVIDDDNTTEPREIKAAVKPPKMRGLPMDPPEYWSLDESLSQGWATIPVDAETLAKLQRLFVVTMPSELGKGRDAQKYTRSYKDLEVVCGWRLEHSSHWQKYAAERNDIRLNMEQLVRQNIKAAQWKSKLEDASHDMPGTLFSEIGERYLLHGTHPSRVLDILHQGFSDKLASLKGMFGAGNYFAEDPEKIDQYTQPDQGYESPGLEELHSRIYRAGGNSHPDEDVFYCFIVRAACGACLVTEGLDSTRLVDHNTGAKVFLTNDRRELCRIPETSPSLSYHTLLVELAKRPTPAGVVRFREIVLFAGNRVYPEWLIAYRRK